MFQSLAVRNYRLFIIGQLVSLIGVWMQFIAQDWLVLQLSDNSGTALGIVTALQFLPILLLSLYAGKLADRYDKRTLLIAANATWAVLAVILAVGVISGGIELWHVFILAGAFGTVSAIESPIRQAFVSELVTPDLLPNALSLNAAAFNSARVVGPALAGLSIAWLGVGPVFMLNALTYAGPLIGLMMISVVRLRRVNRTGTSPKISAGLSYVRSRPDLLLPIALMGVVAMFGYNFQLTLAMMSRTVFHSGADSFGFLTSVLAVGALCGALTGTLRKTRPSVYVVLGGALAFGVLETLLGFAPTYLTMVAVLFPTGFAMVYFAQACNQRIQMGVAPEYRGRVMSLYMLVFAGTTPLGAPLIGWLGEHIDPRSSIYVGGIISIAAALITLAVVVRRKRMTVDLQMIPWPTLAVRQPQAEVVHLRILPGQTLARHLVGSGAVR